MERIGVGIIGAGYWGPNLIRNFSSCAQTQVAAVLDANPQRLESIARQFGHVKTVGTMEEFLATPMKAVAIATPVSTHFALAKQCLEAGLHVMVEKPLAASVAECEALIALAESRGLVLMVDHTYLFGNAVKRIKQAIDSGELGQIYYVDSVRINLGLFQRDINVIWDLAPHDLSIVDYVLGCEARSISASGCAHFNPDIEDMAYVNVDFGEHLMANFHVNWLSPVKVRQMIFAGSKKSLIFNELNTAEPIKIYDRGVEHGQDEAQVHKRLISYRSGDVNSPHIDPGEALQGVANHFAQCIREGKTPLSDGKLGLRVVRLLEAANRSIRAQGGRVVLVNGSSSNGNGHARQIGTGQRSEDRGGRANGKKRQRSLLREPVRMSDR